MKQYKLLYPLKVQYGKVYAAEFSEGQIVDEGMIGGLFEEIKEGSRQPCEDCGETSDVPTMHKIECPRRWEEKEECKHFPPIKTFGLFGKPKYECRYCGLKYDEEKQEQIKPSQWIIERAGFRSEDFTRTRLEQAILDFLDEHFSK